MLQYNIFYIPSCILDFYIEIIKFDRLLKTKLFIVQSTFFQISVIEYLNYNQCTYIYKSHQIIK